MYVREKIEMHMEPIRAAVKTFIFICFQLASCGTCVGEHLLFDVTDICVVSAELSE